MTTPIDEELNALRASSHSGQVGFWTALLQWSN